MTRTMIAPAIHPFALIDRSVLPTSAVIGPRNQPVLKRVRYEWTTAEGDRGAVPKIGMNDIRRANATGDRERAEGLIP
jgi:hypothetical protein